MAYYYKLKNIWLPDKLDASRSATRLVDCPNILDNVWRLIFVSTSVWLNKYRVYAKTEEELTDLEHDIHVRAYKNLLDKVRTKTYCPELSLYLNIRSCCQSAVGTYIHRMRTQKARLARETVSLDSAESDWIGGLASHTVPKLMTNYDLVKATKLRQRNAERKQRIAQFGIEAVKRVEQGKKASEVRLEARRREEAYQEHLEDCWELGVTPITKEEFEKNNYDKPIKLPKTNKIPRGGVNTQADRTYEQREKMREYWREYKRKKRRL